MSSNASKVVSWVRDIAPSHYVLNVESFSSLTEMLLGGTKFYQSKLFKTCGYKWKFSLYPNGKGDSNGHISVFLRIEDTDALPQGWEIYTDLKFFIFDQNHNRYSIFQGFFWCLSNYLDLGQYLLVLKSEFGIGKLVPRDVFDDAANGYLVCNKCVFGVEVFVLDSKFAEENLNPSVKVDKTFTWRVSGYSGLNSDVRYSDEFTACSFRWKLRFYPLGDDPKLYGVNVGLYLELVDPHVTGLLIQYMLCIRDQRSGKHEEVHLSRSFDLESRAWGLPKFMSLTDLRDSSKGFLINDCIIIEARIKNVSTING